MCRYLNRNWDFRKKCLSNVHDSGMHSLNLLIYSNAFLLAETIIINEFVCFSCNRRWNRFRRLGLLFTDHLLWSRLSSQVGVFSWIYCSNLLLPITVGVTKGDDSCPWVQQERGPKTASPKILCVTKMSMIKFVEWAKGSQLIAINFRYLGCQHICA